MTKLTIVADAGINIDVAGLWIENVLHVMKRSLKAADFIIVQLTQSSIGALGAHPINVWELFTHRLHLWVFW